MTNVELAKMVREQAAANKEMRKELDRLKGNMDNKEGYSDE